MARCRPTTSAPTPRACMQSIGGFIHHWRFKDFAAVCMGGTFAMGICLLTARELTPSACLTMQRLLLGYTLLLRVLPHTLISRHKAFRAIKLPKGEL